jgi:hypothetical protein
MTAENRPSDEEIRRFIRWVLLDTPPAEYEEFEARWTIERGQWQEDTERLRALFDEEASAWRARPSYAREEEQWRARQDAQRPNSLAGDGRVLKIAAQTLMGSAVLFFGLAALAGGVANAASFLTGAVVCTAGVSLVILLPTAWFFGLLLWEVVGGIRHLVTGPQVA